MSGGREGTRWDMTEAEPKRRKLPEVVDEDEHVRQFLSTQKDRHGVASGDSSSSYFGGPYKLILTRDEIQAAVEKVAAEIERRYAGEKIVLCGILKGAFIFVTDLCRALNRPYSVYFLEASSYTVQEQGSVELLSRLVRRSVPAIELPRLSSCFVDVRGWGCRYRQSLRGVVLC